MAVDNPRTLPRIWWSNSIFFVATHLAAFAGVYYRPPWFVPRATLVLAFFLWQAACFGITIGYHRMYSHRAFRATTVVRLVLATLGSMAFQGSIKWWCLRHRLHHRFTDDPVHDPYAATRGLFFSHMGWIFYKPNYEKMEQIERDDLDSDPIVRLQHRYYVPLALFFGLVLPTLIGCLWGDPLGSYIWGGLAARLAIWHCTFLINSLAHWDGLQPYSDENTSRGNLVMAMLTCGEGNHNFHHAFPQDFRSGPSVLDWDPSKWVILLLHRFGFAKGLRRARDEDVNSALAWMHSKHHNYSQSHTGSSTDASSATSSEDEFSADWDGVTWSEDELRQYVAAQPARCVVIIDGFAVDATGYLGDHPGGAALLRSYAVRAAPQEPEAFEKWRDASWAFNGGMNKHSRAAKRRLTELKVARVAAMRSKK